MGSRGQRDRAAASRGPIRWQPVTDVVPLSQPDQGKARSTYVSAMLLIFAAQPTTVATFKEPWTETPALLASLHPRMAAEGPAADRSV